MNTPRRYLIAIIVILAVIVVALGAYAFKPPVVGPTGLVGAKVRLQSGRDVDCVAARDVYDRSIAIGVSCDWSQP